MNAPSKLNGIHHITCITADAAANVDFYTRVIGLRLTAKSVNQDDPTVYHLFYGDENARPGIDLTFFEYKHAIQGRPGPGEIHRIVWRVASSEAISFWDERLRAEGVPTLLGEDNLRFSDGEGLQHEFIVDSSGDQPLTAVHPEIPAAVAVQGFEGVRAYSYNPENSVYVLKELMDAQEITIGGAAAWELRGDSRGGWILFDPAPPELGRQGAGSVHHIAWATRDADLQNWIDYVTANRIPSSGYVDRHYFHSLYYREPGGILYELATDEPGFTVDGLSIEELGTKVILPPRYEQAREMIEAQLTPLPNPRADWPSGDKPAAD